MLKIVAIAFIKFYKLLISPAFSAFGIKCRYDPSCSSYAIEAINSHGFWRGGWMTAARLSRCHPIACLGGSSGIDNVPKTVQNAPLWAPWKYGVWKHNKDE